MKRQRLTQKASSLADWPIERRRLIAWFGIVAIMTILLVFWLYSLRLSFINQQKSQAQPLLDINQIRQDLNTGLEEVNKGSELLKKVATTTVSSTSPEVQLLQEQNRLQLDKLRQKLEKLPNQSTD